MRQLTDDTTRPQSSGLATTTATNATEDFIVISADSGWRLCKVGILFLLATYAAVMLNWRLEILRLTSEYANDVGFLIAQGLPLLALPLYLWRGRRRKHRAILLLLQLSIIISLLFGCLTFVGLKLGYLGTDAAFEKIRSVSTGSAEVAVYRTNGGATTAYGVIVRHQKLILPGLLLVRRLLSAYPATDAVPVMQENDVVQITVAGLRPTTQTFRLRRSVLW